MGSWWTRAKDVLGEVVGALGIVTEGGTESASPPAPPPVGQYGDQLRSPQERQRMLREHAARQAQEQREEAEQRRLDAAQFEREVRRHPGGAWLPPPPDAWRQGDDVLDFFSHPSGWRH